VLGKRVICKQGNTEVVLIVNAFEKMDESFWPSFSLSENKKKQGKEDNTDLLRYRFLK